MGAGAGTEFKGRAAATAVAALHKYLCELICWGSINQTCNNIYSLQTNYELYRLASLRLFVPLCRQAAHCRRTRLLPAGERAQCASCGVCCRQPHANINMNTHRTPLGHPLDIPWTSLGHPLDNPWTHPRTDRETRLCVCSAIDLK